MSLIKFSSDPQAAPGKLEVVRALLNTWRIPNDVRVATDLLIEFTQEPNRWQAEFHDFEVPTALELSQLQQLRTCLRDALKDPRTAPDVINPIFGDYQITPILVQGDDAMTLTFGSEGRKLSSFIAAAVAEGVMCGYWERLKICPDCGWAFYDHSKNKSKVWCRMSSGGSSARSCGAIAKVNRYRQKQRASASD